MMEKFYFVSRMMEKLLFVSRIKVFPFFFFGHFVFCVCDFVCERLALSKWW